MIYTDKNGLNWHNALLAAEASKLAYRSERMVARHLERAWGYQLLEYFDVKTTQGFIAENSNHVLITFRGTKGRADWIRNLKFLTTDENFGSVHTGFLQGYEVVRDRVLEALDRAELSSVMLAGHSLGGALGAIAAGDAEDSGMGEKIHSLITFGQPRTGKKNFREYLDESSLGGKIFRLVNDQDIVTRIPPNLVSPGQALVFDSEGAIVGGRDLLSESISSGSADEFGFESVQVTESESPALTEAEFKSLQSELNEMHLEYDANDTSEALAFETSAEGIISGIRDHGINGYIALIREYINEKRERKVPLSISSKATMERAKMIESRAEPESRGTRAAFEASMERAELEEEILLSALVRAKGKWEPPANLKVTSKIGGVFNVEGSKVALEELADDERVVSLELSRSRGDFELTESRDCMNGNNIHRPGFSETGDKCIIGFLDSGIDILHECFFDENGKSRVIAVWDQTSVDGPSPKDVDPAAFATSDLELNYGRLYTSEDIQQRIKVYRENPEMSHIVEPALRDKLFHGAGHGTHVASIAAGRGIGGLADGMAPGAKIIMIIAAVHPVPGHAVSIGYSRSHSEGILFLKKVASGETSLSEKLPLVVNVSQGMNAGPHDGKSELEKTFNVASEDGTRPYFAIVKSAGNEAQNYGHSQVQVPNGGVSSIQWKSLDSNRMEDYFEGWYSGYNEFAFRLINPNGHVAGTVDESFPFSDQIIDGNKVKINHGMYSNNSDKYVNISIYPVPNDIVEGTWRLEVTGNLADDDDNNFSIWVEKDPDGPHINFAFPRLEGTLTVPGTADHVITVGATRKQLDPLQLIDESSHGLTRDGRAKPELSAPGLNILAAKSGTSNHKATVAMSGTSMAAPHISGLLALAMSFDVKSADPKQYNTTMLKLLLRKSCSSSNRHHPGTGYGMIDVAKFIDKI